MIRPVPDSGAMTPQDGFDGPGLFRALTGHSPMRWQLRLLLRLHTGDIPEALDLPTGLGKTAVIALWLMARAFPEPGAVLPRRLVYIVDRRAVVDQATEVATRLAQAVAPDSACPLIGRLRAGLGLAGDALLPVATLRGQLADQRLWLRDPAAPAIIVGTVDMIGSRLLFEGYGVSRKQRPLHASLLGLDTLLVLDEAHLVPPFAALLRRIVAGRAEFGASGAPPPVPWPRLMALSATLGADGGFGLAPEDATDTVAQQRITASKALHLGQPVAPAALARALADLAAERAGNGDRPARIIVFCDRRDDAGKVAAQLRKLPGTPPCELLVGERRMHERQRVADWIARHGFRPDHPAEAPAGPAFLVATSAGEVGIDIDADHLVADLVAWERMVQRLGRVNRRGKRAARIDIIPAAPAKPAAPTPHEERAAASAQVLACLPMRADGGHDASPAALMALKADPANRELLAQASTPAPLRPALTRQVVDAWSLTALATHPGRPEIGPWLRGWGEEEPHTTLIWRRFLPWRDGEAARFTEIDAYFEQAPPEQAERLEAPVWRALTVLVERAKTLLTRQPGRADEPALLVLGGALGCEGALTLRQLRDFKGRPAPLPLTDRTLVVGATLGGLSPDGLLDSEAPGIPDTALETLDGPAGIAADRLLVLRQHPGERPETVAAGWTLAHVWPARRGPDGESTEEITIWKRDARDTETALTRASAQSLAAHSDAVMCSAAALAARLALDPPQRAMLLAAARLHDAGKASATWQDAFAAPRDGRPYAKTTTRWINQALLDGYRHEFGSLPEAEADPGIGALPPELRDLALHLIAAHHGGARPLIRDGGDAVRAAEVALRFARLQRRWGPWGLAWWEALLRAADAEASRLHDEEPG